MTKFKSLYNVFFSGDTWEIFQVEAYVTTEEETKHSLFFGRLKNSEVFLCHLKAFCAKY